MKNLIEKMIRLVLLGIAIGAMFLISGCSGCNSDGNTSSSTSSATTTTTTTNPGSEFVGTWVLSDSGGTITFYLYIESNNTFVGADVPDKTRDHFSGTWSVSGGIFRGPFTNPGVGTGDLVCTIANGVMTVDFIEHWHTPDKHVPYTGRKL